MIKILNGSVYHDYKHRIVINLPPCWQHIADKLSKEIKRYDKKYLSTEIHTMNKLELDDKDKYEEVCKLLTELYQPFFDSIRRCITSRKGKRYQGSISKV